MAPAQSGMDFSQVLPPFLLGDASLENSGGTFLVEFPFVDFVSFRMPDYAACFVLVFGELLPILVGQERLSPWGNYGHNFVGRRCYFGGRASDCV